MYNRYIRNDNGVYTRIPQGDSSESSKEDCKKENPSPCSPSPPPQQPSPGGTGCVTDGLTGFLRHLLEQLHLEHIDTGDLLIFVLLFLLFREDADEELLVALGLLLIL